MGLRVGFSSIGRQRQKLSSLLVGRRTGLLLTCTRRAVATSAANKDMFKTELHFRNQEQDQQLTEYYWKRVFLSPEERIALKPLHAEKVFPREQVKQMVSEHLKDTRQQFSVHELHQVFEKKTHEVGAVSKKNLKKVLKSLATGEEAVLKGVPAKPNYRFCYIFPEEIEQHEEGDNPIATDELQDELPLKDKE